MQKKEKPNIIFITIDALRPRNMGCYGYKRDTCPNIDSLAKKGVLFKNFFSSYNNSHRSFLSILGGRHVLAQDIGYYPSRKEMESFFNTGGVFLPELLQKQEYKTHFLWKAVGWQKIGFDYYFKQDAQEISKKWNFIRFIKKLPGVYKFIKYILHKSYLLPKRLEFKMRYKNNGELITNEAINIINQNKDNNFFLWLHYTDTHVPHIFPHSLRNKFIPEKKSIKIFEVLESSDRNKQGIEFLRGCWKINDTIEDIIAKYDTAIFYDDSLVKKIIETLETENLLENTIVFLFADHGESLDEHELYFTHEGLYDTTFNIPLIIFGKGIPKNKKIESLTQLEDLAPTVLDLIGENYDPLSFDGQSLKSLIKGEEKEIRNSIFIEENGSGLKRRGIRTKKFKYVESLDKDYSICKSCNTTHGGLICLYDLKKDPNENINLAKKNKQLLIEMKSQLNKILKDIKTLEEKRRMKMVINKIRLNKNG